MRAPLPEVRVLTSRLLESRTRSAAPDERADAAEHIVQTIAERISPLLGTGGFQMLLARALKRAQQEHDLLLAIRAERQQDRHLLGLKEAAQARSPEEVGAATAAMLTELLGLMARFLGADMAIRLVRQSFPELGGDGSGSGSEETNDE